MSLSVIIVAKNEEKNIAECIHSVSFADEIILVDDFSFDKTVQIAEKLGARIYKNRMVDFASQRNYALSKGRNEWILYVDADERVPASLRDEIISVVRNS